MEDCFHWEGPHAGAREECEKEAAADIRCSELSKNPIHHHPVSLRESWYRNPE